MPIGFNTQPEMQGFQVEATFENMSGGGGFAVYKGHDHVDERLLGPIIYVPVSALPTRMHPTRILISISAAENATWENH